MLRAPIFAMILWAVPLGSIQVSESVLHIKIGVVDAAQRPRPVPRYALLISDNPPSSTPRRVRTGLDGTIDVRLRPGNYTIESDDPFVLEGKSYEWWAVIDVVPGKDAVLEFTTANANISTAAPGAARPDAPAEVSSSSLLAEWQDSIVALWTPTTHATGFVIDASGLIATNQRAIGSATSVEVQLTDDVKVAATVAASDPRKDVAILLIDPSLTATVRPVPIACGEAVTPAVVKDQEIVTIGSPLREIKGPSFGVVSRVEPRSIESDLAIPWGSSGGPVFTSTGSVVGLTTLDDDDGYGRRQNAHIVRLDDVCAVVASARTGLKTAATPAAAHLPVEPSRPFPADALKNAARTRAGSSNPYTMTSSDYDIAFITPVLLAAAQSQMEQRGGRGRAGPQAEVTQAMRALTAFSNWEDYVAEMHPVLLVRVTPRMVEGFWTKVARGAAQTQGVAVPEMKRMRSGFSRMRAYCGDTEVTPIHPFKLEQRVSDQEVVVEGLYVFDPGAFVPSCGNVRLMLFSEKEPQKGDARIVDAKIIEQIWQDFAPYRSP